MLLQYWYGLPGHGPTLPGQPGRMGRKDNISPDDVDTTTESAIRHLLPFTPSKVEPLNLP